MLSYNIVAGLIVGFGIASTVVGCETDDDCSLNGVCNEESVCECDPGWRSEDCGVLDLLPATRGTGYNYTTANLPDYYSDRGNSSWGGQVIQDREDPTLFHLIVDQFAKGCGLPSWRPFSFIIRGESRTGPAGPYHFAQEVAPSFRHNADVIWSPFDEKYLLYSIGKDFDLPTKCGSQKFTNEISVASADNIRGPWSSFTTVVTSTNPAPFPLYSKCNKTAEIALAVGNNRIWFGDKADGTYEVIKDQEYDDGRESPYWTEDPFLWRDKRGNWHILCHWMIDHVEDDVAYPRVGAHLFSRSLSGDWTLKLQTAFTSEIEFTDGTKQLYKRRERPKMFLSDDGNLTPLYLTTGVQEFDTNTAYTVIQPIGQASVEFEKELGFSE